mgnify:CR=1 FL=1
MTRKLIHDTLPMLPWVTQEKYEKELLHLSEGYSTLILFIWLLEELHPTYVIMLCKRLTSMISAKLFSGMQV